MEAIQVSDSPEHPYRKDLAKKVVGAYNALIPPWTENEWRANMADLWCPNFRFAKMVLSVLLNEKCTFSSREQLKSFIWEAFTAFKMMPILYEDGMIDPLDIDFPIIGYKEWHWSAVWSRKVHDDPSDSDIVSEVEFLGKKIHLLLNRRFTLLESLWKQESTYAAEKHSREMDELMKNLQQQRDTLWSFCTVSGHAHPHDEHGDILQADIIRMVDPSPAESFFLRYMPKQSTEAEHSLFVFHTTGLDVSEERVALYEKLLERKLLLWYWVSKNQILEKYYSDECAGHFANLCDEINGCSLKLKVIPSVDRDFMVESKPFVPFLEYALSQLINMVLSLETKQESLWFMELMAEIIGVLQIYLKKIIIITRKTIDPVVRESQMVDAKLSTRKDLMTKMDQLRRLHTSFEEQHDMYHHASKALDLIGKIKFS